MKDTIPYCIGSRDYIPQNVSVRWIGTGNAFSRDRGSSSLILDVDGHSLLIDCGCDIPDRLSEQEIFDLDAVYVSHIHADHMGGLEQLGFQRAFIGRRPRLPLIGASHVLRELSEMLGRSMNRGVFCTPAADASGDDLKYPGLARFFRPMAICTHFPSISTTDSYTGHASAALVDPTAQSGFRFWGVTLHLIGLPHIVPVCRGAGGLDCECGCAGQGVHSCMFSWGLFATIPTSMPIKSTLRMTSCFVPSPPPLERQLQLPPSHHQPDEPHQTSPREETVPGSTAARAAAKRHRLLYQGAKTAVGDIVTFFFSSDCSWHPNTFAEAAALQHACILGADVVFHEAEFGPISGAHFPVGQISTLLSLPLQLCVDSDSRSDSPDTDSCDDDYDASEPLPMLAPLSPSRSLAASVTAPPTPTSTSSRAPTLAALAVPPLHLRPTPPTPPPTRTQRRRVVETITTSPRRVWLYHLPDRAPSEAQIVHDYNFAGIAVRGQELSLLSSGQIAPAAVPAQLTPTPTSPLSASPAPFTGVVPASVAPGHGFMEIDRTNNNLYATMPANTQYAYDLIDSSDEDAICVTARRLGDSEGGDVSSFRV